MHQILNYLYSGAIGFVLGLFLAFRYHANVINGYDTAAAQIGIKIQKIEGKWHAFRTGIK